MIGWLITLGSIGFYCAGWLAAAVMLARWFASMPNCHGEGRNGYVWSKVQDCRCYCTNGCWRADTRPSGFAALQGSGLAIFWPLLLIPLVVWWLSGREVRRPVLTAARIAELERELGMEAAQ